jgi:hypothetical protein
MIKNTLTIIIIVIFNISLGLIFFNAYEEKQLKEFPNKEIQEPVYIEKKEPKIIEIQEPKKEIIIPTPIPYNPNDFVKDGKFEAVQIWFIENLFDYNSYYYISETYEFIDNSNIEINSCYGAKNVFKENIKACAIFVLDMENVELYDYGTYRI